MLACMAAFGNNAAKGGADCVAAKNVPARQVVSKFLELNNSLGKNEFHRKTCLKKMKSRYKVP